VEELVDLTGMALFVTIVESGSLSAAGRALSMPKATVSYIGDAHDRARSGVALAAPDAPNYSRSGTGTLKPLRVVDTRL
jgi:hypothetical protein